MRQDCERLTEAVVKSGHFMAQEKPESVNAAVARWLAIEFPTLWRI
jgi:soluble epoxide hydrolase/lipid-phosphate phosphatase